MYDPKIARFLQEDTYIGDPNDPLSLNLYTYCHNEPIMYNDPTGHVSEETKDLYIRNEEIIYEIKTLMEQENAITTEQYSKLYSLARSGDSENYLKAAKEFNLSLEEMDPGLLNPGEVDLMGLYINHVQMREILKEQFTRENTKGDPIKLLKQLASLELNYGSNTKDLANRLKVDIMGSTYCTFPGEYGTDKFSMQVYQIFNEDSFANGNSVEDIQSLYNLVSKDKARLNEVAKANDPVRQAIELGMTIEGFGIFKGLAKKVSGMAGKALEKKLAKGVLKEGAEKTGKKAVGPINKKIGTEWENYVEATKLKGVDAKGMLQTQQDYVVRDLATGKNYTVRPDFEIWNANEELASVAAVADAKAGAITLDSQARGLIQVAADSTTSKTLIYYVPKAGAVPKTLYNAAQTLGVKILEIVVK